METVSGNGHRADGQVAIEASENPLHRLTRRLRAWRDEDGGEAHWAAWLGERVAGDGLWERLAPDR